VNDGSAPGAILRCAAAQVGFLAVGSTVRRLRVGVRASRGQVAPYRAAWEERRVAADTGTGPLWVVLGDSAAQGVGATAFDAGYVGQVQQRLEARDGVPWRVVNLAVSGARAADVLREQIPLLLSLGGTADLVTCLVGGNDLLRTPSAALLATFRSILAALPRGTVVGTMPQGLGRRKAGQVNALIRSVAPAAGLLVADVWERTGPPWRGKYADDFFHPNELGYADWADALAEALGLPATPAPR
jgi:lysophospholipase L1-like esterase